MFLDQTRGTRLELLDLIARMRGMRLGKAALLFDGRSLFFKLEQLRFAFAPCRFARFDAAGSQTEFSARLLRMASRFVSLIGVSFPSFWLGLILILIFAVRLKWLPVSGRGEGFEEGLKALVLPAVTLGTAYAATLMRLLRSSLLEVLNQDFIRTARAKGLRDQAVLVRHALRNALIPVVTVAGLQIGFLLSGSVIVEVVFSWPGVGRLVVDSIGARDYPIVQAAVVLLASALIVINLAVDLVYAWIDPRIHYS